MKVGIMQPYFCPYIGYFSLIKHTDMFILFDTVQFIRHGWIERNRILKPNEGWQYIMVPLIKFPRNTLILNTQINNEVNWKERIFAQLNHYKKKAPFFNETMDILNSVFSYDFEDIVSLNKALIVNISDYLGFKANVSIFSQMDLKVKEVNAPDEWALNICLALGNVSEYWNPPGGRLFFDKQKYIDAGLNLKFLEVVLKPYNQFRPSFEPGLSIIDCMMFNNVSDINAMLDEYYTT